MRVLALFAAGVLTAATAIAHHGFGTFAMNEDIELSGVVTELDFVNPHSWLHLEVMQKDGSTAEYRCEMRSATTLRRSGWTPDMFPPGMHITIQGVPDRIDDRACYVTRLIFDDGAVLDRYSQRIEAEVAVERVARLPNGHPNLAGEWAVEQRIMTDPTGRDGTLVPLSQAEDFGVGGVPEGQSEIPGARGTEQAAQGVEAAIRPPRPAVVGLTEAGEAAREALIAIPRAERSCMMGSIVSDWGGEPVNRIEQGDDAITLMYGLHGLVRRIDMRSTIHPQRVEPSRAGHSIGWWDGDVLVVDTVGFEPGTFWGTTPHSEALHVVERFSIDPETTTLTREYRAEDPLYFTAAYTGAETLIVSNVPYAPEPCEDLTPQPE